MLRMESHKKKEERLQRVEEVLNDVSYIET
jgi:hypothetical protein